MSGVHTCRYPVVLAEALGLGLDTDLAGGDLTAQLLAEAEASDSEARIPSSENVEYPPALSRVLDGAGDVSASGEAPPAAYPAALADLLDQSEQGGVEAAGSVVANAGVASAANYPAALANVLDLAIWPTGRPTQDVPQVYPAALAQLYLDLAEALEAGEDEEEEDAGRGSSIFDIFSKFDKIAQDFSRKFGV